MRLLAMSTSPSMSKSTVQLLVLDRIDATCNMSRYYVLSIEPTMFEDVALVREWGRTGTAGRRRIDLHADAGAARTALDSWLKRKVKRGYSLRDQHTQI